MSEDVSPASSTDWRRLEEKLEAIVTDSGVMLEPAPRAAMQMPSYGISGSRIASCATARLQRAGSASVRDDLGVEGKVCA